MVLGQVRPATTQTLYRSDWVGTVVDRRRAPARRPRPGSGEIIEGEVINPALREEVRALCIPVRLEGD